MKKHLTIVIKLGTSSIVDEKTHEPLLSILSTIVETACALQKEGHKVVIVSSGAIGVALGQMNLERRPKHLPQVQALAAIGQCKLMALWDQLFIHRRQPIAQILLTRGDIADRTQYLNAQNTFIELLHMGTIPIVNENDTLSVAEIKFGDNDTLSAITAAMVQADYLFLMTDVDCLYDSNPRTNPSAKPIEVVEDISLLEADVSSAGSSVGTGGMSTKITAARLATSAGVTTIITRSNKPGNIASIITHCESLRPLSTPATPPPQSTSPSQPQTTTSPPTSQLLKTALTHAATDSLTPSSLSASPSLSPSSLTLPHPPPLHTRFLPIPSPIRDRYFWLLHGLRPHGTIYIDAGAHRALMAKAGLLPVGVVDVEGTFGQQECVRLVVVQRRTTSGTTSGMGPGAGTGTGTGAGMGSGTGTGGPSAAPEYDKASGEEVGRALVNYSAAEVKWIRGLKSTEIEGVLGYADSEYVALRENIAFLRRESRPVTPTRGTHGETAGR
ncbi:Aspartate/glutamate/uridylate kinase [Elsinoe ampelina]|uniref:Aspartate/glutamate/uridylate kinase n=1 Tax=Elsinoe ampelina TaxID=302913 RepID=A0A6A6GM25_9PEZI|nr:Aspartate/glutamate/uridylate kinase [Elsinoe ampelina]